jgi:hypothetical protein
MHRAAAVCRAFAGSHMIVFTNCWTSRSGAGAGFGTS